MSRTVGHLPVSIAAAVLVALAVAGCATAVGGGPQKAAPAGFTGYKWSVIAIGHDGRTTSIPASYPDYLGFTPDGGFAANEPINYHSGAYRVTGDGFTVSDVGSTLVGYDGHDPVVVLSEFAIDALGMSGPVHATAKVTGDRLIVVAGGYTLICKRDGRQPDFT